MFGRDKKWHIDTVFKVLSLAGDDSPKGVLNNTAKILIDGKNTTIYLILNDYLKLCILLC